MTYTAENDPIELAMKANSAFTKFETGAMRSSDANSVALWLISPIAMQRLAKYCKTQRIDSQTIDLPIFFVEKALDEIWAYLAGNRDFNLEEATINVFRACGYIKPKLGTTNGHSYIPVEGIFAVAKAYKEGELKYSSYQCELGFPVHDLLNHCLLHLYKFLQQDTSEDQLGHAGWNLCMAMHSEIMWPNLNKGKLRGPNCSLTEDIKEQIKETMAKKKLNV